MINISDLTGLNSFSVAGVQWGVLYVPHIWPSPVLENMGISDCCLGSRKGTHHEGECIIYTSMFYSVTSFFVEI